jgi:hypothetical protein
MPPASSLFWPSCILDWHDHVASEARSGTYAQNNKAVANLGKTGVSRIPAGLLALVAKLCHRLNHIRR